MQNAIPLSALSVGMTGNISGMTVSDSMRRRLQDIGFTPGTSVVCLMKSPMGEPKAYLVKGALIAVRKHEAEKIFVTTTGL